MTHHAGYAFFSHARGALPLGNRAGVALLAAFALCFTSATAAQSITNAPPAANPLRLTAEPLVTGLTNPWGMAFLPDGSVLITERPGRLSHVSTAGTLTPLSGLPRVAASGQGGLLDVEIDPDFAQNGLVYLSYAEPGRGGSSTAVGRGRLDLEGGRLAGFERIFSQVPKLGTARHFGSRLVFAPDGTLFITLGDRANRPLSQDNNNTVGTIVRINPDGSIPADNPFAGQPGIRPEIYSYGHRNIQGAGLDGAGELWTVEHGARGGDEINHPKAGLNYGWPVISYGRHYSGGKIGSGTSAPGMEQPVYYFDPSIAPSGLAVVSGSMFPEWEGDLLVGALKLQHLSRLERQGDEIVGETRYFEGQLGRIRDVKIGPDGAIYVLTDAGNGALYRIARADGS